MTLYNNLDDYQPHLDTVFSVPLADGHSYPLTLVGATPLPARGASERPPFELRFTGPGPGYLPQQIHAMAHPALGECSMFLVAIGQNQTGFDYQAIFN